MNKKKLIVFSVICLLAVLVNVSITYVFVTNLFQSLQERKEELNRIYQYNNYLSNLKDAETGERGYIITGDPSFLDTYYDALNYFNSKEVVEFFKNELNNSNKKQVGDALELQGLAQEKLNILDKVIAERKNHGFEEAKKIVENTSGKKIMDKARRLNNSIKYTIKNQVEELDKTVYSFTRNTIILLIISNLLAALLLGLCLFSIYKSIKNIQNKEKEISQTLEKLHDSFAIREAILNSSAYSIISVDSEGIITSFNPAAEKMLGYSKEEVIGKCTPSIFHDVHEVEERAFFLTKLLKRKIIPGFDVFVILAKEGIADCNEWTYIRKDGSHIPVSLCVTALKNIEGVVTGYLGIAYDISERKEINQMKNDLIAITSHELRSPVVAIKGVLDLLSQQEFALPDTAKKIMALGEENCARLVHLTDDILNVQKIDAGRLEFNFKKINITSFLSQVLLSNTLLAQQAQISLNCQTVPPQWAIQVDEERLMQVMTNLVSNAINHSPVGSNVEIRVEKIDSKIRFEVKDHGLGISPELQPKIFHKFAPVGSSLSGEKKGSGLGLYIAKSIIEKHNSTINFQSNSNGTTFWFELPLVES